MLFPLVLLNVGVLADTRIKMGVDRYGFSNVADDATYEFVDDEESCKRKCLQQKDCNFATYIEKRVVMLELGKRVQRACFTSGSKRGKYQPGWRR
jgi:hypothetical protein